MKTNPLLYNCVSVTLTYYFSFVGDDWELCALEWRHWRMAAGIFPFVVNFNMKLRFICGSEPWWVVGVKIWIVYYVFFLCQKCVAFTGNNMRKQTPAPGKKEKDVSLFSSTCLSPIDKCSNLSPFFQTLCLTTLSHPAAFWGGPVICVFGLHRGEHATVTDEAREAQNIEKQQERPAQDWSQVMTTQRSHLKATRTLSGVNWRHFKWGQACITSI